MDFELANALGRAVERKDMSTAAHTWRVTMYAQAIGEKVGLAKDDLFSLMLGAVLHDIGKLDIPREILTKPGRLDDVEYEMIKQHTVLGYDRLRRMGVSDPRVLNIVRSHHERLDGSGYPDQLVGDEISREARWFAVIDGFDAMTSLRPYRKTVGTEAAREALAELQAHRDTWYDPEALDLFEGLFKGGHLDSILSHLNDDAGMEELARPSDPAKMEMARQAILASDPPGGGNHEDLDEWLADSSAE